MRIPKEIGAMMVTLYVDLTNDFSVKHLCENLDRLAKLNVQHIDVFVVPQNEVKTLPELPEDEVRP